MWYHITNMKIISLKTRGYIVCGKRIWQDSIKEFEIQDLNHNNCLKDYVVILNSFTGENSKNNILICYSVTIHAITFLYLRWFFERWSRYFMDKQMFFIFLHTPLKVCSLKKRFKYFVKTSQYTGIFHIDLSFKSLYIDTSFTVTRTYILCIELKFTSAKRENAVIKQSLLIVY